MELAEVERVRRRKDRAMRFPPAIEAAYAQATSNYRARAMRLTLTPLILIYNAFMVIDYLLLPESFLTSVGLHLSVTSLVLSFSMIVRHQPRPVIREALAACISVLVVVQIMTVYRWSVSGQPWGVASAADQYQYLAVAVVAYMNVNQRLDFRFAIGATALIAAIYLGVLLPGPAPFAVKLIGACSMAAICFITLMANRRMERDARYTFLVGLHDRLQREHAEDAASRDALTGLWNRRHLDERVKALWQEPDTSPISVVMIDIDHFKAFNDRYGHPEGDLCIRRVANVIQSELRETADIAVRCGGEEFLLVLPRTTPGEAARIAERVRRGVEALAIPHEAVGPAAVVTASLGWTTGTVSGHQAAELIAKADAALYDAKRNGRNRVHPRAGPVDWVNQMRRTPGKEVNV